MTNRNEGSNKGRSAERGFGAMDKEQQREIASKGGKVSHERGGSGNKFTSEEAREADKKGGENSKGVGRSGNR